MLEKMNVHNQLQRKGLKQQSWSYEWRYAHINHSFLSLVEHHLLLRIPMHLTA